MLKAYNKAKQHVQRIKELESELEYLQEEIKQCYPPKRPKIQKQINSIESKIAELEAKIRNYLDNK